MHTMHVHTPSTRPYPVAPMLTGGVSHIPLPEFFVDLGFDLDGCAVVKGIGSWGEVEDGWVYCVVGGVMVLAGWDKIGGWTFR